MTITDDDLRTEKTGIYFPVPVVLQRNYWYIIYLLHTPTSENGHIIC